MSGVPSPSYSSRCSYSIVVRTSCESSDDIDASVFVQLCDKSGRQSDKCRLSCSITHRGKFKRGHSDLFLLVDQPVMSEIARVNVWFRKKSAKCGAWKLHSINIIRHTDHTLYRFPGGKWMGQTIGMDGMDHTVLDVEGRPFKVLRDEDFEIHS